MITPNILESTYNASLSQDYELLHKLLSDGFSIVAFKDNYTVDGRNMHILVSEFFDELKTKDVYTYCKARNLTFIKP